jgi:erythromycin esterase
MRVDASATGVYFGGLQTGIGTAWFDSFSLEIDGQPYNAAAPMWTPTAAEVDWVRTHAIKLATWDPREPLTDLRPLAPFVGDARIVALGEGTHGTAEFFRMKHRLTEYLATEKGFTVFAIEANMPEARRVNEYVLTGRGDPKAALAGMYFWTWNTQEVLDMIEWMRQYNASGKGHIEFWGFDLQTPTVAMDSVRAFVARAEPAFAAAVDSAYQQVRGAWTERTRGVQSLAAVNGWQREAARVVSHLTERRGAYIAAGRDTLDIAWAIQNARIVEQAAGSLLSPRSRDSSMAANVDWIAAHQPPGTKMALWAHNGHVNRVDGAMGGFLAKRWGSALRVVGFALGEGQYTAYGPRGLTSYPAEAAPAGTAEAVFRATGVPRLALDLRDAQAPAAAWLTAPHRFRSIGSMAMDQAFSSRTLAKDYDMLIYFDQTSPSVQLGGQRRP